MDFFNNAVLFRHFVLTTDPTPEELATLLYATTPETRTRVYGYIIAQPDIVDVKSLYIGAARVCAAPVFLSMQKVLQKVFVLDPDMDDNVLLRAVCSHRTALVNPLVIVNNLLHFDTVDPSTPEQRPLILACAHGHVSIVRRLLSADVRVDAGYHNNVPLAVAAANGQLHMVQLLMSLRRVRDVGVYDDALMNAILGGHADIVRYILSNAPVILITKRMVNEACERGHVDILDALLSHDPSVKVAPVVLKNVISRDHLVMVQLLMEKHGYHMVDVAIAAVASFNALKIMRYLIFKHNIFVPGRALTDATKAGHASMVSLILETRNVDIPSNILLTAIVNNHGAVADVLLSDERVFLLPQSMKIACGAGADRVVWALLRHGIKARPEHLSYAIEHGDFATAYVLIRYGGLTPTAEDVHAARADERVLRVILQNSRPTSITDEEASYYELQAENDTIAELWRQYRGKDKKPRIKQPIQVQQQVQSNVRTMVRCFA